MTFSNYTEFIDYLNKIPNQQEQLKEIIQYCIDNVEVDYVMIEHINEIVTVKFTKYVDTLFPNINEKLRLKAISFLKNSTNISNSYWERIKSLYLDTSSNYQLTLTEALISIVPDYREINGLLLKGTSEHITHFVKKVCDDINIKSLVIKGISSGRMQHFWLNICINDTELFYDITYALYVRDNFCEIGKHYHQSEWLGITPKQLHKNQPSRTIISPNGFNLEYLGLNDFSLSMKDLFLHS